MEPTEREPQSSWVVEGADPYEKPRGKKTGTELTPAALRKIFTALCNREDFVTIAHLSQTTGLSAATVGKAVKVLLRQGLLTLTKEERPNGGRGRSHLIGIAEGICIAVATVSGKNDAIYLYDPKSRKCERVKIPKADRCNDISEKHFFENLRSVPKLLKTAFPDKIIAGTVLVTDNNISPDAEFTLPSQVYSDILEKDRALKMKKGKGTGSAVSHIQTEGTEKDEKCGLTESDIQSKNAEKDITFIEIDSSVLIAEKNLSGFKAEKALLIEISKKWDRVFFLSGGKIVLEFPLEAAETFAKNSQTDSLSESSDKTDTLSESVALLDGIFSPDAVFLYSDRLGTSEASDIRKRLSENNRETKLFFRSAKRLDTAAFAAEATLGLASLHTAKV